MEHHPTKPPSSAPAFEQCPRYVSGPSGEAAAKGVVQHKYLEHVLKFEHEEALKVLATIEGDGRGDIEWASKKIASMLPRERHVEERAVLLEDFEEVTWGTVDVHWLDGYTVYLVDYKSGEIRDYRAQMATYARALMNKYGVSRCVVREVYGRYKHVNEYVLNLTDTDYVLDIYAAVDNPESPARPCDYCNWCSKKLTCEAVVNAVVKVQLEYEPENKLETFHASEILDPRQMAIALQIADCAEKWAESVKHHAKNLALTGAKIPGWELKEEPRTSLNKEAGVNDVFQASGLAMEKFADCCKVEVGKLRDAIGLDIGMKGGKSKKATEEFNKRFGALMVTTQTVKFQKEKKHGKSNE